MFNVEKILDELGRRIVAEHQRMMNEQRGVDGNKYAELSPKTIKQKMKISSVTADKRMIRTKDFQNNAFGYFVDGNNLSVFVRDDLHGRSIKSMLATMQKHRTNPTAKSPKQLAKTRKNLLAKIEKTPTYSEIALWQNGPKSKFFPTAISEVNALSSVRNIIPILQQEIGLQIKAEMSKAIRNVNRA